jgi:hypothetical protein
MQKEQERLWVLKVAEDPGNRHVDKDVPSRVEAVALVRDQVTIVSLATDDLVGLIEVGSRIDSESLLDDEQPR